MSEMKNEHIFKGTITKEEISKLPLTHFQGDIHIINDPESLHHILPFLKNQHLLGFDTETKPSFKKGPNNDIALMQLATKEQAFLIRINKTGFPPELAGILSDENIIKAGVGIRDDLKGLQKITPYNPAGFIELQKLVVKFGLENISLKKIAAIILNIRISKSQRVSNWENEELSQSQQLYAATDAWICYEIYERLKQKGKGMIDFETSRPEG